MEKEVIVAIVGSLTTLAVAIGGWVFYWAMHRDAKTRDRLEKKVLKLEKEVEARMDVEKSANLWIAELAKKTPLAAMREVRKRAKATSRFSPKMSPSDLDSKVEQEQKYSSAE